MNRATNTTDQNVTMTKSVAMRTIAKQVGWGLVGALALLGLMSVPLINAQVNVAPVFIPGTGIRAQLVSPPSGTDKGVVLNNTGTGRTIEAQQSGITKFTLSPPGAVTLGTDTAGTWGSAANAQTAQLTATGNLFATSATGEHLLKSTYSGAAAGTRGNTLALWSTSSNIAAATRFLADESGVTGEYGASGYLKSAPGFYLDNSVYLSASVPYLLSDGSEPVSGSPPNLILGQEGYRGGSLVRRARLKCDTDWVMYLSHGSGTVGMTLKDDDTILFGASTSTNAVSGTTPVVVGGTASGNFNLLVKNDSTGTSSAANVAVQAGGTGGTKGSLSAYPSTWNVAAYPPSGIGLVSNSSGGISLIAQGGGPVQILTGGDGTDKIRLAIDSSGNTAVTGPVAITSSNAAALSVGPAGNTNPVLRVAGNVASQADGVSISGGAVGVGTTFQALSSGSNFMLILSGKGTKGTNTLGRLRVGVSEAVGGLIDNSNYGTLQLITAQNAAACFSITEDNIATGHFGFASASSDFVLGTDGNNIAFRKSPTATLAAGTLAATLDLANKRFGVGTVPSVTLDALSTTEQLRLRYDASNYTSFTTSSGGDLTITPSGGDVAVAGTVTVGSGGTAISKVISATAALDFGSITAGTTAELNITVTGTAAGDTVVATPSGAPESGLVWSCFAATDAVTVRVANVTGSSIDPASRTWRGTTTKF